MPNRLFFQVALIGFACLFYASTAWCQPKPANKVDSFTQQDIEKAIQARIDFLMSAQLPDGSWPPSPNDRYPPGYTTAPTAMAVYSLIEAGISAKDPRIVKALDWLAKNQDQEVMVYSMGFRCNAWLAANKQTRNQYMKNLQKDVDLLVANGIYYLGSSPHYLCESKATLAAKKQGPCGAYGDNSNSQYVLFGVWAGHRGGMEIPKEYWDICLKNWIRKQTTEGGWNYGTAESLSEPPWGAMTTAGLASLFVCIDATMGDKFVKCNVATEYAPVKKGLDWFDANFEKILAAPWRYYDASGGFFQYFMYGIERVGLASGYKYFGKYDWFKEGTKRLLAVRMPEKGAGVDSVVESAYIVLFLARGSRPVLFNRLEYDGDWNNRPRALANFCRWAENAYEHEVNWQIITLKSEVGEWHDAPVVLITGSRPPKFSDEDMAKLRTYVEQGGTLLSITECNGAPFGMGMKNLYKKLFPKYELASLGRDHPLYTAHYKLAGAPAVSAVSNGIRPLAIHIDADLPQSWHTYAVATAKAHFEAGANVLSYVTEKELYNRGAKVWPDAAAAANKIKAARIRYAGNYDPEPLALERLSRLMAQSHKIQIDYYSAISASAPASQGATPPASAIPITGILATQLTGDIKLAFMTGTGAFKLTAEEKDALKKWIDAGGLLILDAAGGSKTFSESAKDLAGELYGPDALLPMPLSSPVYQIKDMTIDKVKYRKTTKVRIGGMTEPRLLSVLAGDKPKVILSAEDLTAGMVGYSSWGLDGYDAPSAFNILRNIVLYAAAASK
ncbi:MAG: DUF4159 domain-containing protein [Planctomycetes bacterium]|nr:DUF4159 domain-containing protein [Planctomycetota bacterium]